MLIVESAELMPGSCYVTGRNDGPFVDTGYDIDDRPNVGRVYIAASAVWDMVAMLGGCSAADAARYRDAIVQRDARIAELEAAVEGLVAANKALSDAGYKAPEFAPLDDLLEDERRSEGGGAVLEGLSDEDLIQLVLDAGLELPASADRQAMVDAIVAHQQVPA